MNKYITQLYGHWSGSTALKAQQIVTSIAKQEGYQKLLIPVYNVYGEDEHERVERIKVILAPVTSDDLIIVQVPSWNGIAFDEMFLKILRQHTEKVIIFIHDFVPMMFVSNEYLFERYVEAYNLAYVVIVPSFKMGIELRKRGLLPKVIVQDIWDFTVKIDNLETPKLHHELKFIGNIERFPFAKKGIGNIPLNVYSTIKDEVPQNINYKGWKSDNDLMKDLSQGGFGLVWSEDTEEQRERKYSEMNTSFKLSTYLAAGIPVIVNKGLSKQEFIEKYKIGLVAETLEDVSQIVESVSPEEYAVMQENIKNISKMIRDGYFTRKLLVKIQEVIYLEGNVDI